MFNLKSIKIMKTMTYIFYSRILREACHLIFHHRIMAPSLCCSCQALPHTDLRKGIHCKHNMPISKDFIRIFAQANSFPNINKQAWTKTYCTCTRTLWIWNYARIHTQANRHECNHMLCTQTHTQPFQKQL